MLQQEETSTTSAGACECARLARTLAVIHVARFVEWRSLIVWVAMQAVILCWESNWLFCHMEPVALRCGRDSPFRTQRQCERTKSSKEMTQQALANVRSLTLAGKPATVTKVTRHWKLSVPENGRATRSTCRPWSAPTILLAATRCGKADSSLDVKGFRVENSCRTVQYKLNPQSLRTFGLRNNNDAKDVHRAGANRLKKNKLKETIQQGHVLFLMV